MATSTMGPSIGSVARIAASLGSEYVSKVGPSSTPSSSNASAASSTGTAPKRTGSSACAAQYAGDVACPSSIQLPVIDET